MLVLDTDHFSEWERGLAAGERLRKRVATAINDLAVSIVTVEEQTRGWLAKIRGHQDLHRQIAYYAKFQRQVEAFAEWTILPWDADSAALFIHLRAQGIRIGAMDLKIACIVMVNGATLLNRNTADFARIPGLRFENWLD